MNNAGATWGAPLAEFPADAWDKVLDLNVKSPFFLTRALLPQLEAAATADDPARVINIGSIDAHPGADARDLLVLVEQGRDPPADPSPRAQPRAQAHHRERDRARARSSRR